MTTGVRAVDDRKPSIIGPAISAKYLHYSLRLLVNQNIERFNAPVAKREIPSRFGKFEQRAPAFMNSLDAPRLALRQLGLRIAPLSESVPLGACFISGVVKRMI